MTFLLIILGSVVFGLASVRYGAESRPGFDERFPIS